MTEEPTEVVEKNLAVEKQGGEGEATDAKTERAAEEQVEKEPENKVQYHLFETYLYLHKQFNNVLFSHVNLLFVGDDSGRV